MFLETRGASLHIQKFVEMEPVSILAGDLGWGDLREIIRGVGQGEGQGKEGRAKAFKTKRNIPE